MTKEKIEKVGIVDAETESEKYSEIDAENFDQVEKFWVYGKISRERKQKLLDEEEIFVPEQEKTEKRVAYRYIN